MTEKRSFVQPAEKRQRKKRIDTETQKSNLKGWQGLFETFLRRFRIAAFIISLIPVYLLAIFIMALGLTPGTYLVLFVYDQTMLMPALLHYFLIASSIVIGFFLYGFSILFLAPFFNFILPFRIKPFRGPYFSIQSVPWYVHNSLIYLVRYTFLEFVTPTPLNILFYKMMGMKIGKGVHINTTNISDAGLITLEDYVTIGGSAHLICHYAARGYLVVSPVVIKKGATLGLKSTVMGDVQIGESATIAPHEVILPKSRIPSGYKGPGMNKNGRNQEKS